MTPYPLLVSRTLLLAALGCSAFLAACGGGDNAATQASVATESVGALPSGTTPGTGGTSPSPATDTATAASEVATNAARLAAVTSAEAMAQAAGTTGTAVLSWKPVTKAVSYRVYYGTASRRYLQNLGGGVPSTLSALTLTGLTSGQTYFFSVTGVDSTGKETPYSDEMTLTVS